MLKELIKTKEWIIDVLWPKTCLGCGREGAYICKDCEIFLSEVDPILGSPTARISGSQAVGLPDIVSVWEYEGLMEKLILKIKYDGCYDIIGELMDKAFGKMDLKLPEDTVITYVPMWKKKEKRRGFNQAELIAKKMSRLLGVAEQPMLEKVRDNRSQVGLSPQERTENVKGVFRAMLDMRCPVDIVCPNILLVDDVYTTGATIAECIKVLKKAGVKNVYGFTLARKLRI